MSKWLANFFRIGHDKANDIYRADHLNSIFALCAQISPNKAQKKGGQTWQFAKLSACVAPNGLGSNFFEGKNVELREGYFGADIERFGKLVNCS